MFANLNNTLWGFLDGLIREIDWATLGQSLATGVTSLFETLDLNTWASMASGLVSGITTALLQFLENMDLAEVAIKFSTTVSNMFANMDPEQIGTAINLLFSSAFTFLESFFNTDAASSMTTFFTTLIDAIDWDRILNYVVNALLIMFDSVGTALSNSNNPLFSAVGDIFLAIGETIEILKPAIDAIMGAISPLIQSILPIISTLLPPIADIVSKVVVKLLPPLVKLIQAVMPILIRLAESLLPVVEQLIMLIADDLEWLVDIVTAIVVPVIDALAYIIEYVADMVTIAFKLMRGEFSSVKDLFNDLLKAWKKPINAILSAVEAMVNGVVAGLNGMIKSMNKLSFDIPDWVPKYGGQKFGLNLKEIKYVSIPRLAQGAVIPPNKEFLAMLGDQKNGTNIEAPLDTIKQALAEVLAELGGVGSKQPIILQVNGRTLAQVVWDEQEKRYKQTGKAMA
jgi:phage-related protein